MKKFFLIIALLFTAPTFASEQVGQYRIGHEKLGMVKVNGVIRALKDDKVEGVTCHIATVEKNISFVDPTNASIACRQTGPIKVGNIKKTPDGEDVNFKGADKHWLGSFFKDQKVRRIYDEANNTLIYVVYTTKVINGSYKQSISTISLYAAK